MNLVYDLQAYSFSPYGGITRMFDELFTHLAGRPEHRAKICMLHPPHRLPPLAPNVRICSLHTLPGGLRNRGMTRWLVNAAERAYWRGFKPDLFHATFYPDPWPLPHLPAVVNVYDLIHEKFAKPDNMPDHTHFLRLKRRALKRASRIICISHATKNALLEHYEVDPAKIRVVHLGRDPLFRPLSTEVAQAKTRALLQKGAKPYLLYIGSRQRYKNFHRLVAAYGRWPHRNEVDLAVVGPVELQEDRIVNDLCGWPGHIRYLGHVDDETLCALYNLAVGLVYPSLDEGFGIPLLEAQASGCRLCISDIPVFREVVGDHAVYFDPQSVDGICAALDRVYADHAGSGREAPGDGLATYSWDRFTRNVLEIYEEMIGAPNGSHGSE